MGPVQPELKAPDGFDLKSAALRFIHTRCEDLLFDEEIAREEAETGTFAGTSQKPNQIPFNMEMDINRLCLEREMGHFIDSGSAQDAYGVYYCYFEIFCGRYGESRRMIDLLSEFESNASSILLTHRDHYAHSVYVFALGLAIYETNEAFRKAYKDFCHISSDESDIKADHLAAHRFLAFWGMTSLLHDIGYTFELPFEEMATYFEISGQNRGDNTPYLVYANMETMTGLSDAEKEHFRELYQRDFSDLDEVFAFLVTKILGKTYDLSEAVMCDILHRKATAPQTLGYEMDHAYYSAIRIYRELVNSPLGPKAVTKEHMNALTAILIHNYLFNYPISFYKSKDPAQRKEPLPMEVFPLAYLLLMCDELQCWDRTSYGRNTRQQTYPIGVETDLSGNALHVTYIFDKEEQDKIDAYEAKYAEWERNGEAGDPPVLKSYSTIAAKEQGLLKRIKSFDNTDKIPLTISYVIREADRKHKHVYLSNSSFLHLYDFAVALNGRYTHQGEEGVIPTEQLEAEFESLSLEYKISNIAQARSFAQYLNAIRCFYTDRPVDYDMVTAFSAEQVGIIGPMEHERWLREKIAMGWQPGNAYRTMPLDQAPFAAGMDEKAARAMLREQLRMHELLIDSGASDDEIRAHYRSLAGAEQQKDFEPFNSMLKLIRSFDGLRIYRLPG